jgi:hypothetical protein
LRRQSRIEQDDSIVDCGLPIERGLAKRTEQPTTLFISSRDGEKSIQVPIGRRPFWAHRGVAYWEGSSKGAKKLDKRILLGTSDGKLMALEAASGKPVESLAHDGAIDLREGVAERWPSMIYTMTSPATIYIWRILSKGFEIARLKGPIQ